MHIHIYIFKYIYIHMCVCDQHINVFVDRFQMIRLTEERIHSLLCGRRQCCGFLQSRCSMSFNRFNVQLKNWQSLIYALRSTWKVASCRVQSMATNVAWAPHI